MTLAPAASIAWRNGIGFCYHASMSRKPTPQPDDPEQFKRFIDMAREVEADESQGAVDRALEKVIRKPSRSPRQKGDAP